MALVNHSKREINVKVVYAGMPRTGKATNLSSIYQRLKPEFRGQTRTIPMEGCVMRMCEFQPPGGGAIPGFTIRYHLYTLTGEAIDDAQWRMVLKGADGIVFVVDANPANSAANRDAFAVLLSRLNGIGLDLSQVPIVVQGNFQDSPAPLSPAAIQQLLAIPGLTVVPANAARGEGVLETLTAVVRKVTAVIQKQGIPLVEDDEEVGVVETNDTLPIDGGASDEEQDEYPINPEVAFLATETASELAVGPMPALLAGGEPLDIPIALEVAGVKKEFIMTVSLREAGAVQCEPLRGAAYVR